MTGKLIDADALIEHLKNDPLFDLVEQYGLTRVIETEITIEAIPVEWIKQFIKKENIHISNKVGIVHMVEQWKLHPIDFEISSEDAIPVEWLKENYPTNGVYGTERYFRTAHAVEDVLKAWELEKEKRKEG